MGPYRLLYWRNINTGKTSPYCHESAWAYLDEPSINLLNSYIYHIIYKHKSHFLNVKIKSQTQLFDTSHVQLIFLKKNLTNEQKSLSLNAQIDFFRKKITEATNF